MLRVGARRSGELPRRVRSRTLYTLAELPRVLPRSGASLFHAVGNVDLPLLRIPGVPFVLTVHDLIPLTSPDTVSSAFHWQFRLWLARSLRVADHVVCVSAWTRSQLLARHPELDPARVSVVHNGVDHARAAPLDAVSQAWLRSLGLPERWVLFAGALDARKNVGLVLDALERLGPAAPTLVLAGQRWYGAGPLERRVGFLRARGVDIRPIGFLAEPLLWALMAAAPVFVFPSRDEGFGLPPLEAMALGHSGGGEHRGGPARGVRRGGGAGGARRRRRARHGAADGCSTIRPSAPAVPRPGAPTPAPFAGTPPPRTWWRCTGA